MAGKQRNYYLNYWKGIACFGVVFVHTRFPIYEVDGVLQTLFRFTIPLFFMISGYFCYGEDRALVEKKLPEKMQRIFWINLAGCFYYFMVQLAIALFGDSHGTTADLLERFHMMFNGKNMINWLVFNQDPFVNIMWFTSALLYSYILFWLINRFNLYRLAYSLIPVLIFVHFVLGNVLILFGLEITKYYYRNFLLFGLPFFMLGNWLRKNETVIMGKLTIRKCQYLLMMGLLLGAGEWFLVGRRELYLGSLVSVIGIFIWTLYQPEKNKNSFWVKVGEEYSLLIYIVHYSVMIVMERFSEKLIVANNILYYVYGFVKPFIIFCISLFVAFAFNKALVILEKWRNK